MKRAAALFLFLSLFLSAKAQHCPFDYVGILVVSVIDPSTGEAIDNASISMVDQAGNSAEDWRKEELLFVQNPASTDPYWTNDDFKTIRYSFAGDNYILPLSLGFSDKEMQLKIESPNQAFEPIFYPLDPSDYFDLHDNIGDWTQLRNLKESPKVDFDQLIVIEVCL